MATCAGTSRVTRGARGFSLVELVIVVVIIGLIAAIAVPRISNAASSSAANALELTLANVRKAIDEYYAEHGKYPGYNVGTGTPSNAAFLRQLLQYTDAEGNFSAAYGWPFIYGPYLRRPFPKNPINGLSTVTVKATPSAPNPAAGSCGWVAVLSHGYFGINATTAELNDGGFTVKLDAAFFKGGADSVVALGI